MSEPILDARYWARRLREVGKGELHHAIFRCDLARWRKIEQRHREILNRLVKPTDSILDCGCGWGRLLELLPGRWHGAYLGVDLSPDFVSLARERHGRSFMVADLRDLSGVLTVHQWAICVSIRPMVKRNCGDEVWQQMEAEIKRVANRLLYLEYDPDDGGEVS